jgi:DNA-binding response OmpR family regulator
VVKVLIVDDSQDWRSTVASIVRAGGHTPVVATSAVEAESLLSQGFSFAVVDVDGIGDTSSLVRQLEALGVSFVRLTAQSCPNGEEGLEVLEKDGDWDARLRGHLRAI